MESNRIIQHANMQLRQVELIHLLVQVVGLPLTCVIKLWMVLVVVKVAVVADKSMRQFEWIRGLLAHSVGLAREGDDAQRVLHWLAGYDKLQDVALLHSANKIKQK